MTLMLAVGIPVLLIFGGALLAFSFSAEADAAEADAAQPRAEAPSTLVFVEPVGWSSKMKESSVEEIVSSIETHLRKERRMARAFAEDPSSANLHLDS